MEMPDSKKIRIDVRYLTQTSGNTAKRHVRCRQYFPAGKWRGGAVVVAVVPELSNVRTLRREVGECEEGGRRV